MPDLQAVRPQLHRILASDVFVRARRMQRLLVFIVEETLAGRADQLGEYGIGISVFDRGQDFGRFGHPPIADLAARQFAGAGTDLQHATRLQCCEIGLRRWMRSISRSKRSSSR